MEINRCIEHTNLKPTLTGADIDSLVKESIDYQFIGLCVPPFWVKRAARELGGEDIQMVTVIGFPLGYQMTESRLVEIEKAIDDGANELDIVMNISAFKSGMPWAKIELAKCAKIIHSAGCMMKIIIETAYLNSEEIVSASKLCADAGSDFVKTSTGFAGKGAQLKDVKLMRDNLPSNVGIKASGGIKSFEDAKALLEAGADRLGTSSGVQIMRDKNDAS